ncbi:MAG TPA: 3-hydroxyacyl-CoA dehydrogenase NAD-binding domain-containing protein, partial [Longimicrobiales bacterium]
MSVNRIAVIGAGTMGNGIAHVAAQSGRSVRLVDVSRDCLDGALATVARNLDRQIKKGLLEEGARDDILGRIETGTDIAAGVADVDLVVEAAPEKAEIKRQVFNALD